MTILKTWRDAIDRQYRERVKELNCLYSISTLMSEKDLTLKDMLMRTVDLVAPALQYTEIACARIVVRSYDFKSDKYRNTRYKIKEPVVVGGDHAGFIELGYTGKKVSGEPPEFLEEEKSLLKGISGLLGNMIAKKDAEHQTRRTLKQLKQRTSELEQKQSALHEILSCLDEEKQELRNAMVTTIERNILPLLHMLNHVDLGDEERKRYIHLLEEGMNGLLSSRLKTGARSTDGCTPREIQIVNLIRSGQSNKEIAETLHISVPTVERHRHNIRKKLGISGKKVNLAGILNEES